MKRFDKTEVAPSSEVTRTESPTERASISSDVLVPLLQASISGGAVAALITLGINEFVVDFSGNLLKVWAFWALLLSTFFWLALLIDTRKLLREVEQVFNVDLDGDGHKGEPQPKRTIQVEVRDGRGQIRKYFDAEYFEIDDDCLLHFARGIVRDWNFTEGRWIRDRGAFPKGVNQYRAFRGKLEDMGYIVKENDADNATRTPTAYGKSVFRRLAEL